MFNLLGMDTSLGVGRSEEEHVWLHIVDLILDVLKLVHPLIWDIGNMDVFVDGLEEIFKGLLELFFLIGHLEGITGIFEILDFIIAEGSLES